MKRIGCILIAVVLLLASCTPAGDQITTDVKSRVLALANEKVHSVETLNSERLMSILDPEDQELRTEQANWLADMKVNPIEGYSLEVLSLEKISDTVYKAKLRQKYVSDGKAHKLEFYNEYKLVGKDIYDAGTYFEELKQGNITIKYNLAFRKLAEEVIEELNQLYEDNIELWDIAPKRPMVIKMYDDIEELRQSIKFSMWQCAGWYEYGESVKLYMTKAEASKIRVAHVVNHEMTHLFTVEKSAGNLAYWFSEGLATYYELEESQQSPELLMDRMNVNLLTIDELEQLELEKLEDQREISNYYNNAHVITAFIIETYGTEKVREILSELGKLPSFKGTTSENDKYYRGYLSEVLPKVLGLRDYEEFKQKWKTEISRL